MPLFGFGCSGAGFASNPFGKVPRVELALDFIKTQKISNPRILDLGAGSGCVGFSILKLTKSDYDEQYKLLQSELLPLLESLSNKNIKVKGKKEPNNKAESNSSSQSSQSSHTTSK